MTIDVVTVHELDLEEYAAMQRESFRELLRESGVSESFLNAAYYRWKYSCPAQAGKIAVVRDDGAMVASNAMMPLLLTNGTETVLGWQSCDTATVPKARGKGYFKKCLNALEQMITPEQVFFGYPNKNSMPGFLKLGWKNVQLVPTYIKPLALLKPGIPEGIIPIERFDVSMDTAVDQWNPQHRSMLKRNSAYLNWRYVDHPTAPYACYGLKKKGTLSGIVVVRKAEIMHRSFGLIMEIWGATAAHEHTMLKAAQRWAKEQRLFHLAMLTNRIPVERALAYGFVKIPTRFLPKQQILMGSAREGAGVAILQGNWIVQLGDWDGF